MRPVTDLSRFWRDCANAEVERAREVGEEETIRVLRKWRNRVADAAQNPGDRTVDL